MKKSTHQSLTSSGNTRLRALIKGSTALPGEVADAKVCNDIAIGLFDLRIRAGWTQKELAEKLSVKQSNISRWEQVGYQGYKVKMLSKVIRTLGGQLHVTITPPSDAYLTCIAFRQTKHNKITATSPDGWKVQQEIDIKNEFIMVTTSGVGAIGRTQYAHN